MLDPRKPGGRILEVALDRDAEDPFATMLVECGHSGPTNSTIRRRFHRSLERTTWISDELRYHPPGPLRGTPELAVERDEPERDQDGVSEGSVAREPSENAALVQDRR